MTLEEIDFLNGISSLIFVVVSIVIGLTILYKYFKLGDRAFLFIGFGLMAISEPWIPSGVSFLWNLFFEKGLSLEIYVILGNIFVPLGILCWLVGFTDLIFPKQQKPILITYILIGLCFEIVFFILLFTAPALIGEFSAESLVVHIDIEYRTFILGYLLFVVATVFVTGIIFAYTSIKSKSPPIQLKGKFILTANILWSLGAILDTSIPLTIYTLPITRIFLVISALLYYMGFLTPQKITQLILKEKTVAT